MSSPITLSNFNNIDFNLILNSVMQQESVPLQVLQDRQSQLSIVGSAYGLLATRLGAIETATVGLSTSDVVKNFSATVSDTDALTATTTSAAVAGRYEVVVNELARSQVTVSGSTSTDADVTIVAAGGTLTIGGTVVQIVGPVTLQGLANQINATAGVTASATVIESAPGQFRLVLTGIDTGISHAFTLTNQLTGGSGITFTDTDGDGTSGDTADDNAVQATNASVLVNNILITSASNTLTSSIPGTTLTLGAKDPAKTIVVLVATDNSALVSKVQSFVSAYNDLVTFAKAQSTAAASGQQATLAHDSLLRSLRSALRSALGDTYGSGTFAQLATVGIGFDQSGKLTLDEAALASAVQQDSAGVATLFAGTSGSDGAFTVLQHLVHQYTQAGGLVSSAQTRIEAQTRRLDAQISDMQARLAIRRAALQREFTAADQAMTALKSQSGSLASLGSSSASGLFSNF